jgi:hypothetical protein
MPKALATKNLTTQDAVLGYVLPEEWNGGVALFLGANSTGTVILEYRSPYTGPDGTISDWVQIKMKNPQIAVNADVDNLVGAAAAQYAWAECVGIQEIRARRTDAAGSDCYVSIGFGRT